MLSLEIIQHTLGERKMEDALLLLQHWESYRQISDTRTESMDQEIKIFIRKMAKLEEILKMLNYESAQTMVNNMEARLQKISIAVKNEPTLNAGGKFEWVDSVLIKCLQDGSWLLVDNVNLCSSAVLDRLNALLEPSGVLTISERGVDSEGKMVEIKPHKDFRLFLTMDPKNGEISRAMRNRGIEIYLLNEIELQTNNSFDRTSLVTIEGLPSPYAEVLINIHNLISEVIIGEKPNINELIQVSTLLAQQLKYQENATDAFVNTIMEVYYKTRSRSEFICEDFLGLIREKITDDLSNYADKSTAYFNTNLTLRTQNIYMNSSMEKIKQQSVLLFKLLEGINTEKDISIELCYLIGCYYSITSLEDLNLRHSFLTEEIKSAVQKRSQKVKDFLLVIINHLYEFIQTFKPPKPDLPLDKNWISNDVLNDNISNRLNLGLYIPIELLRGNIELINQSEGNIYMKGSTLAFPNPKGKRLTLMEYAVLVHRKKVEDRFDNIIIQNYAELHKECSGYFSTMLAQLQDVTDGEVIQILYLLLWWRNFFKNFFIDINKANIQELRRTLLNLPVHYKWFYKFSMRKISSITKIPLQDNLEEILNAINSKLDKQFSVLHKLGKNYQKCSRRPPPFTTKEQLDITRQYNDAYQQYDTIRKGNDPVQIFNKFTGNKELRVAFIELKSQLNYDFNDACNFTELLSSIDENKLKKVAKELTKFELQLLPLLDIFAHFEIRRSITSNDSRSFVNNILIPTDLSGALVCYHKTKDVRLLHEINKSYLLYLMNSPSVRPQKFLGWQKNFELDECSPKLTYLLSGLLVESADIPDLGKITLGNFRDLMMQHDVLNMTLWKNLYQLSDENYSFICIEKRYVTKIYEQFLNELAHSLKIDKMRMSGLGESSEEIITCLKLIENDPTCVDSYQDIPKLIRRLEYCSKKYLELNNTTDTIQTIINISHCYQSVSYLKATFNSKLPTTDPLVKKTIKRQYCRDAQNSFKTMKTCYEHLNQIYSNNFLTKHAYCVPLENIIEELEEKHKELSKYVAYRPDDVLYETVCGVVSHAFSTILSEEFICNLDETNLERRIEEKRNKVASYENFIHELSQFRSSYPDIIEPLLSNIAEFLYGLKLNIAGSRMKYNKLKYSSTLGIDKDSIIMDLLIGFPVLNQNQKSYNSHIKLLCSNEMTRFVNYFLDDAEQPYVKDQENFRLLKSAIQESFNNAVVNSKVHDKLSKNDFLDFNNLVNLFINAYNKQQEQNEIKKNESESLYKIKTLCDEKPEEEQINEDLRKLFPNYHSIDFADFQQNLDNTDVPVESEPDAKYEDVISYNDLTCVVQQHTVLLKNFTKTEWLNPTSNKTVSPDFILPLIEKYKTFSKLLDKIINSVDYTLDERMLGSLNILLAVKKKYGITDDLSELPSFRKKNDFYKDPNVEEVKSCYHILEELKIKINELLDEWPDQPTLKTIIVVIERIYNFEITSPISRYLTGFEILFSKCHEWEQVAHSGVSLSQHFQSITNQIITWRKLELSMWKDLLSRVYERLNETLPKWWLFLFNTMHQFIYRKQFGEKELIETLQAFMTKSNLAEYQGRLDLLLVFHCHATFLDRTKECESFINILWNVHIYFKQFSVAVNQKIKDLRTPIEKKLKDYVKIVRWKDISYWAIKDTVEKSHKTLHGFMRSYQEALEQPVLPCLHNPSNDDNNKEVGLWDKNQTSDGDKVYYSDILLEEQHYLVDAGKIQKTPESSNKLINAVNHSVEVARDTFQNVMQSTAYADTVKELYTFISDVIETSSHLQKLEVDTTLPKEKQKSQAKNILQQKHRAVADLFKTLSKMGLSYKSGIVENKIKDHTRDFLFKPIDLIANFGHQNYGCEENKIKKIWESSEKYYVRCLMRLDVLDTALQNPAKDLGMQNVERCKGFGLNLLTFVQKQKINLIETSRSYYYMRYYYNQLSLFCDGRGYLPSDQIDRTINVLTKLTIVVSQYQIILKTCPEEDSLNNETLDIPVLHSDLGTRITYKNDEMWFKTTSSLSQITTMANKLISRLLKAKAEVPSVEHALTFEKCVPLLDPNQIGTDLQDIVDQIRTVNQTFGNIALTKSLCWLEEEIQLQIAAMKQTTVERLTRTDGYRKKLIKSYLKRVKLVTGTLMKHYSELKATQEKSDEESEIKEEQIKKYLVENMVTDLNMLDIKSILADTQKLVHCLLDGSDNIEERKELVKEFLPLLEQMILGCRYFVTQLVSGYRATSKMCSILLNIFIDLASKGFCIPPEFSDEFDKEGISKPSDGMGLGEGQGERDVSDKIESEDQLDDAQPAGEEKHDDDKDCKEEEKGIEMSEDFDSKLQDKEKKEGDDSDVESNDSDAEEQMGETEKGADQSNKETWKDDEEEPTEEGEKGTEEKEEKGDKGEKEGAEQLGAKDGGAADEEDNEAKENSKDQEKNKKEINEMEEPEYDDEQIDPHHGKQPELPEPEPMDLPDDMQLDEGEQNDEENQNQEENPFDIDTMQTEKAPEETEKEDEKKDDTTKDDENDFSSDDENVEKSDNKESEVDADVEDKENKDDDKARDSAEPEKDGDDKSETGEDSALDQTQSKQENIEAMEVDDADASDKAQANKSENQQSSQPIDELQQEDRPDQEGTGQSQMEESSSGHTAQTTTAQDITTSKDNAKEDQKRKERPGESDSKRSLGDIDQPIKKKLKTIDSKSGESKGNDKDETEENSEMYQHIKDAQESKIQTLDVATKEQAENQKHETEHKENEDDEHTESSKDLPNEEEIDMKNTEQDPVIESEKHSENSNKKNRKDQHPQGDVLEELEDIQIEGDVVGTHTVSRSTETTHHTQFTTLLDSAASRLSMEEINSLRLDVENQLSAWNEPPSTLEADQAWQKISSVTSSLAQDLSEQLRLVLEPTQASRLKGDFRTGRRINMRKVIPYIASQFRKDKIWLRRTKPSKREYQIVLAIDDSSSMADNHSKELAFESVALISKALTLLESGQLAVLSFGEKIEVIHKLTDNFTDNSGIKLLQKFQFDENKTCVATLVDFATEMFNQSQLQTTALNAKLLVVVSDGRGVFSEGEAFVKQAVRRAKLANIFMVFVIIDNPENKNSVLDIRMPVFKDGKLQEIQSYMDVFPFSFYIILRDINSLPSVLSDALRQWFELVSNLDK